MEKPAKKYPEKYKPTVYQIVCWHCKRAHVTLYNIPFEGKKSNDYTCADCKVWGAPPIWNASRIILKKAQPTVTPPTEKLDAKTLPSV
jgi:hypothetical protein